MRQAIVARILALTLACLLSVMSLERAVEARPLAEKKTIDSNAAPAMPLPYRMNKAEAKKYGLLEYRLAVCSLPEFVAENSDLFDPETKEINIRDIIKYWKFLHKQMMFRYGSDELKQALRGLDSDVQFDEVDRVFFELRKYILCLATDSD